MAKRKKKARAKSNTYVSSTYTEPETTDYERTDEAPTPPDESDEDIEVDLPELARNLETSKAWRFAMPEDDITTILLKGKFGSLKLIPWGSNYTFIAPLCLEASGKEYAVIYKPMRGEAPLWDFPSGTLYKREYCAYIVAHALGWHFIPPVVVRDGPHGIGTVQLFVDVDERQQYYEFQEQHTHELKRIAIFDFITNNADRKAGHCLLGANNLVWAIDHGICFNHVPKLRTIIWEFAGQPIPDDICQDLAELATDTARMNALVGQLNEWLDPQEVELFLDRLESVLRRPQFPGMNSRRQVPWGFF